MDRCIGKDWYLKPLCDWNIRTKFQVDKHRILRDSTDKKVDIISENSTMDPGHSNSGGAGGAFVRNASSRDSKAKVIIDERQNIARNSPTSVPQGNKGHSRDINSKDAEYLKKSSNHSTNFFDR